MIALYSRRPEFCANCGVRRAWDTYQKQDWNAGASQECRACRMSYARSDRNALLEAADKSGSDLSRYVGLDR